MGALETFQKYMGSGLVLIWFLFSLVYLFFREKRKSRRILFVYVPVILLVLYFNLLFTKFFFLFLGDEIYFRLCWLLPVVLVLAYTVLSVLQELAGKKKRVFAVAACLLIVVSGKLVYSNPLFERAENIYHMPQEVVDICDAIEIEGREVMAAFPDEFLLYVRQYSPLVRMPYGRGDTYDGFYRLMNREEIDADELAGYAKEWSCHYIILPEKTVIMGSLEKYGYEKLEPIDGYVIYRDTTQNFSVQAGEKI